MPKAKKKGPSQAELFRRELSEFLRMRQQIDATVADLERKVAKAEGKPGEPREQKSGPDLMLFAPQEKTYRPVEMKRRPRPVRLHVLDCLEDLGWMAYTREIAQYSAARYGREITSTRYGPLVKDEATSYQAGTTRPVWLCFALTHDRLEPIKRLLGRSDWPLEWRIVAPTSGRVQHLKLTARLCELALKGGEMAADPLMLKIIAADHARDLPGIKVKRGQFDLTLWRDMATDLLSELLPRDQELRCEAAARLEKGSEFQQLFGMPEVMDLEPGRGEEALRR